MSMFKVKFPFVESPREVDVGGLIGQSEDTKVMGSSADVEIEYKQD
ncbi:hypothetical protein ACFLVZ_02635 [Chloroflexota bacterium]